MLWTIIMFLRQFLPQMSKTLNKLLENYIFIDILIVDFLKRRLLPNSGKKTSKFITRNTRH